MNTIEAIHSRRSIRKYTEKPISSEIIKELISCAMSAPSANNQQLWHFIIINNRSILDQIPKFSHYAQMCKKAPCAILVCGNKNIAISPGYFEQDCAAATQNILLAAHEKEIGSVWTGVFPKEDKIKGFQSLLKLPKEIIPFGLVVLGYPAEKKPVESRYKEERVHHNCW